MTDSIKKALMGVAALVAFALGGAAVAGAVSGNSSDAAQSDSGSAAASTDPARNGPRGQRSDETLLTGDTAAKVKSAALAEVSGGTIERVETDGDGHAAYEAHMTNADGERVTVYVDEQFDVVEVESR